MTVHKDKSIAEQAAEWLKRLKTAKREVRQEFLDWLSESPLHVREVLLALTLDTELRLYFRRHRMDAKAILDSAVNVHELGERIVALVREDVPQVARESTVAQLRPAAAKATAHSKRSRWFVAAAACAVALLTGVFISAQFASDRGISTQASEWQRKILPDGTIARIGPRTKLIVEYAEDRRTVRLIRGEALFYVMKNPARPFIVETDIASARAVGTAFAVSLYDPEQVRVTVKEGVVAVARASYSRGRRSAPDATVGGIELRQGDELVVTPSGTLRAKQVNLETALAWENVELYFEHVTIEQAILEFNRRNELQIRVVDQTLLKRTVTGRFDASDPKKFSLHLEKLGAVAVMDEETGTLLIAPYPDPITIRAKN